LDLLDELDHFSGAKIALLNHNYVLSILRDDIPTIPYPNTWDLPGGGREEDESPFECVQREVFEELGILLSKENIVWAKTYPGMIDPTKESVFMVGMVEQAQLDNIVFGDEGQGWKMMTVEEFLRDDKVYGSLKGRLKDYLEKDTK
jgi:8-oxo-dGTP diphosphatase